MDITTEFHCCSAVSCSYGGETREIIIKLSYIFLAKQEISEAYTNVPAKTHVNYLISMSVLPWHNIVYGSMRELSYKS